MAELSSPKLELINSVVKLMNSCGVCLSHRMCQSAKVKVSVCSESWAKLANIHLKALLDWYRQRTVSVYKIKLCGRCSTSTKVAATLFRWSTKDALCNDGREKNAMQNIKHDSICCRNPSARLQCCCMEKRNRSGRLGFTHPTTIGVWGNGQSVSSAWLVVGAWPYWQTFTYLVDWLFLKP